MLSSFGKGEQPFRSYIIITSLYFYCFSTSTQSEALESDSGAVSQWVSESWPPTAFLSSRKSRSQWEGAAAGVHQSSGVVQPELHAHWPHPTVGLLLLHTAVSHASSSRCVLSTSSVSATRSLSSTPEVIVTALLFSFYHGSSLWCYLTSSKRRQWVLKGPLWNI